MSKIIARRTQTSTEHQAKMIAKMEEERERDNEKVRARFICLVPIGGDTKFFFKKYKGDPVELYHFEDGKTYTIPRMVYNHIRENCYEPIHNYRQDENGVPQKNLIGRKIHRFDMSLE